MDYVLVGRSKRLLLALSYSLLLVSCHVPFWEGERLTNDLDTHPNSASWTHMPANNDWSFEHPFNILEESALIDPITNSKSYRPTISLSLENSLNGRDDVDILLYNKTDDCPLLLFGLAQVPACLQYKRVYPVIALLGPSDVRDVYGEPLFIQAAPFSLPFGYGAYIVRHPPHHHYSTRPAYQENVYTGLAWMYPQGYTEGCANAPALCGQEGVLAVTLSQPAPYYWAIWIEGPRPDIADVGFVTGYDEEFALPDLIRLSYLLPGIRNGATLHKPCSSVPEGFLVYPEG